MPSQEEVEKSKVIGAHKLKMRKYLADDGETIVCELAVNESLRDLIKQYAVTNQPRTSVVVLSDIEIKRYKIKTALANSVQWIDVFYPLFTEDIINSCSVTLKWTKATAYASFVQKLYEVRSLIRIMEELRQEEKISVDINVRRSDE